MDGLDGTKALMRFGAWEHLRLATEIERSNSTIAVNIQNSHGIATTYDH